MKRLRITNRHRGYRTTRFQVAIRNRLRRRGGRNRCAPLPHGQGNLATSRSNLGDRENLDKFLVREKALLA
jgi:hypothetical protein